jgi:hypothetical protein
VWVLALVHQFIGFIWFSPFLFSQRWLQLIGRPESDFASPSPLPFIISLVSAVVLCYLMAGLFTRLQVRTASRGLAYSLAFWFGFLFLEVLTFNSFELRPMELALINAGKSLVTFAVTGFMLGFWTKKKAPAYKPSVYATN